MPWWRPQPMAVVPLTQVVALTQMLLAVMRLEEA